ncbi:AAA family ATPase [Desertivirga arenae]|uniref:AAA family ATPase n=1 Tax=Desertivirga arenae TaxID=2810309 RepID=UPI001A965372|nr:AAA family ATPase [Pedobacter sp. SYSU D00823]
MTNLCNQNIPGQVATKLAEDKGCNPVTAVKYLNFNDIIEDFNRNGSNLFRKVYQFDKKDYSAIYKTAVYAYQDQEHAKELGIDLGKGLFIVGPIGCGKTSLMQLLQYMKILPSPYHIVSVRDICLQFSEKGVKVIKEYGATNQKQPPIFCFDDLGGEPITRHYGSQTNVMQEILLSRYDLFVQKRIPTHVTTNLSASELESKYGSRVRSRLREMFNLISFPADSYDKRR